MAVDLRSNSMFQRMSVVLEPDCLVKLEHQMTKDRVRKVMFNRVSQVTVSRGQPWVRIVIVALILVVPGLLLLGLVEEPAAKVIGVMLLVVGALVDAAYLWYGKTTLRISYGGKTEEIKGVFRPAKVKKLVAGMRRNIQAIQALQVVGPTNPAVPPPLAQVTPNP